MKEKKKVHAFNYDSKSEAENLHFTAATVERSSVPSDISESPVL